MVLLTACNSSQSPDQSLKDDSHRTKIMSTMVKDPIYAKEMVDAMMHDDNCKQMMMDKMMSGCKDDTSMCKMMMGKTMEMCNMDESKCDMMMGCMKSHTNVMKSMKGMCDMASSEKAVKDDPKEKKAKAIVYTCSMHPEIIRDKPGKCPKCGMDLVVKK